MSCPSGQAVACSQVTTLTSFLRALLSPTTGRSARSFSGPDAHEDRISARVEAQTSDLRSGNSPVAKGRRGGRARWTDYRSWTGC